MARYASNTRISQPIAVNIRPDANLNGIHFSYTIGFMFPQQAAMAYSVIQPPAVSTQYQPTRPAV